MSAQARHGSLSALLGMNRFEVNGPLIGARNTTNLALIGAPRGSFDDQPRAPQNPEFITLLDTVDLGSFTVTGLRVAVAVLATILREIAVRFPHDLARLGVSQMLACRLVKGSSSCISNHAWGLAADLTIDGATDPWSVRDGPDVLRNLYPVFRRHGFCWGAAFAEPEPMHFEASDQLVRRWAVAGAFGPDRRRAAPQGLTIGDRGPTVLNLQQILNARLAVQIDEDGVFGIATRAAVTDFQARHAMRPNGVAGLDLMKALDLQ